MSKAKELFDETTISNMHKAMILFKDETDIIKEELDYADKCHNLEEQLGCPLEEIIEFIKLLKKYYYVDITGQLIARTVWNNIDLNEEELYKINHIFNKIKDKSE